MTTIKKINAHFWIKRSELKISLDKEKEEVKINLKV